MPLDNDEKECEIKEWISTKYKSRPRFARLLHLEWLEEGNDELSCVRGFQYSASSVLLHTFSSAEPVEAFNSDILPGIQQSHLYISNGFISSCFWSIGKI